MSFLELAKKRYSCKKYDGRPVSAELLGEILEAGRLAPTAKNMQEQRVYVLQSAESLAKFDSCSPCRYGAATVLVVAYIKDNVYPYQNGRLNSGMEDASIVATQMMLAAADIGVDSCWLNRIDTDKLASELGLPENEEIVMALDVGYAAEGGSPLPNHASRKPLSETVAYL